MRKLPLVLWAVMACACGGRHAEAIKDVFLLSDDGGAPTTLVVRSCQAYDSSEIEQACVVDSDGKSYGFGGDLAVTSPNPPYGVYFRFAEGYRPNAADVVADGAAASARAYAAPYNVLGNPCCAEFYGVDTRPVTLDDMYDENNRIAARAQLDSNGGLLVSVHDAYPDGTQIAILLQYSALYRSRIAPPNGGPCNLPGDMCSYVDSMGWTARFYVGAVPPVESQPGAPESSGAQK